jgi:hypothetical protein
MASTRWVSCLKGPHPKKNPHHGQTVSFPNQGFTVCWAVEAALFPLHRKISRGIKPLVVGSAQRVTEQTGVTVEMLVRKNHVLFSSSLGGTDEKHH